MECIMLYINQAVLIGGKLYLIAFPLDAIHWEINNGHQTRKGLWDSKRVGGAVRSLSKKQKKRLVRNNISCYRKSSILFRCFFNGFRSILLKLAARTEEPIMVPTADYELRFLWECSTTNGHIVEPEIQ
jgi:predicted GH43/DUF377 family glycosyl hydrolase